MGSGASAAFTGETYGEVSGRRLAVTNGRTRVTQRANPNQGTKKDNALICAAIDFGTTYSGYAFSFYNSADKIHTHYWPPGQMTKTPTVVLLEPSGNFHSFGMVAMDKYKELLDKQEHKEWYLFERFKMKLYEKGSTLSLDLLTEDITGKTKSAIEIFSASISYITDHLLNPVNDSERMRGISINKDKDIHWILTVPAIWSDRAKVFMRTAAVNAGIPEDMLSLALEPEAASLDCRDLLGEAAKYVGYRYMVLDLGGGTADITAHEVADDGNLTELHPPTGGDFGGTKVDIKFDELMSRIFGETVLKRFKQEYMQDYWELMLDLERKKKMFNGTGKMILHQPVTLTELFSDITGSTIEETILKTPFKNKVQFKLGKIYIAEDIARQLFDDALKNICEATLGIMQKVEKIEKIILVGGFSESPYLEMVMREKFNDLVDFPKEPSGAVLRGAVRFGQKPTTISTRVCPYTYGIARMVNFKSFHPPTKKVTIGGIEYCDNVFNIHISKGTKVSVENKHLATEHKYYRPLHEMSQTSIEVYASDKPDPEFVDEPGCRQIGLAVVDIDPTGDMGSRIWVKLIFGGTELELVVRDEKSRKISNAVFKLF
ncbi:heat shock 70 kDa protein 12A-like [Mya arenaria]|uniref:heat shock 70 kDa protein 12A-like n=1 Tax=Mya arenaria TaxID=6604 RepID=UPI0022E16762|nr:heat shock 70 kDa protein 12A-like [Mya arenaria]